MSPTRTPRDAHEHQIAALAASLPTERADLLAVAVDAVHAVNAAILAGNLDTATDAATRYEAAIWQLNGGTFFACRANDYSAANVLADHCAAPDGLAPKWGQRGDFLIACDGMRARVIANTAPERMPPHFAFHAVDLERPFISETGYLSHFGSIHPSCTVEEAACAELAKLQAEHPPRLIAPQHRTHCRLPDWLPDAAAVPALEPFADERGQFGFAF